MYKIASDKRQRALHQGRPIDWVNGDEQLEPKEHLEQLVEGIRIMHQRIAAARGAERRALIVEQTRMENEVVAFRKEHGLQRTQRPELPQYFVNCARVILPPVQFEIIMNAARRDYERAQKREQRLARL